MNRWHSLAIVICLVLFAVCGATAQQSQYSAEQFNVQQLNSIPAPIGASAASDFENGSTIRYYFVIAHQNGAVSAPTQTRDSRGPTTLSNTNGFRVTISWTPVPGATYDVLESSTATLPALANCTCAVATATASGSIKDIGTYGAYSTAPIAGFPFQIGAPLSGGTPELDVGYNGVNAQLCVWVGGTLNCGGGASQKSAPNQNVFYLSPNCGSQSNCFTTPWDTRQDTTCSINNGSTLVTCSDAPFKTSDVGKYIAGFSGCVSSQGINSVTYVGTALTQITAFNSSTSVNISFAATGTELTSACVYWGHSDDTAFSAAEIAADNSPTCPAIQLPMGIGMWLEPHIHSEPAACTIMPENAGASYVTYGFLVQGQGPGNTVIFWPPTFDFAACTFGASSHACITSSGGSAVPSDTFTLRDFGITMGGFSGSGLAATINIIEGSGYANLVRFMCTNVAAAAPNVIGFLSGGYHTSMYQSGLDGCGGTGAYASSAIVMQGNSVEDSKYLQFFSGAGGVQSLGGNAYQPSPQTVTSPNPEVVEDGGSFELVNGDGIFPNGFSAANYEGVHVGGAAFFICDNSTIQMGSGSSERGLQLDTSGTSKAAIRNCLFSAPVPLFLNATGGIILDQGGNSGLAGSFFSSGFIDNLSGMSNSTVASLPAATATNKGATDVAVDIANTSNGVCVGGGSEIGIAISSGVNWQCSNTGSMPSPSLSQVQPAGGAIGTTAVTVAALTGVVFPVSGGPWRASIAYQLPLDFTLSVTNVDCWVSDGTNTYVPMSTANSNGAAGGHTNGNGAGWSTVTYANGATETFDLDCQGNANGATLLTATPTAGIPANFQMLPVAAN